MKLHSARGMEMESKCSSMKPLQRFATLCVRRRDYLGLWWIEPTGPIIPALACKVTVEIARLRYAITASYHNSRACAMCLRERSCYMGQNVERRLYNIICIEAWKAIAVTLNRFR